MTFEILYCRPCGYAERARDLARELRERFGAEVQVEEGKFGQFDVRMDGALLASRGQTFWKRMVTHGAPSQNEILEAIERHQAVQDGDACEIPKG